MKKYTIKKNGVKTEYEFITSSSLPQDLPISTPLTFPFIGKNIVLIKRSDKNWWDVPGGKVEEGESWEDTLKREAVEEAGVITVHHLLVGYILATNSGNIQKTQFPEKNILPVTLSFVKDVVDKYEDKTVSREAFKETEARDVLKQREDNGQLLEIFDYVMEFYEQQKFEYEFEYIPGEQEGLRNIPKTQAMVFVKSGNGKFFAVRDLDEKFYSLPGGGCYMNELDEDCARREVREEAQCEVENLILLGTVMVRVKRNGVIFSESRQLRYIADSKNIDEFIPYKNGAEIVERIEVDLEFLQENTKILKNKTGGKIVEDLRKKL